jgi:cell division protein FtsB
MTLQEILNSFAGVALAALGWFARELWSAVQELKRDLGVLREELPKTYVTRNDYKDDIRELKDMLSRIFDRLDDKADK